MPKPRAQRPDPALGVVIRRLREQRDESQEALAYRASMASASLSRIELAQSSPAWSTVQALADALGVGIGELATLVEREQRANS